MMILDIALGIIIAFVVLSMGRVAVWLAIAAAAFYFGYGVVAVLAGALFGLVAAIGWAADHLRERRADALWRKQQELIATLPSDHLVMHDRREPTGPGRSAPGHSR